MATELSTTVLVVDDELDIVKLITLLLKSRGYQTLSASNGREALATFKANEDKVSLLLTDILMPEMDGLELAVQIRRLQPHLPILFVSGFCEKIPGSLKKWEGLGTC